MLSFAIASPIQAEDSRCFEMRVYEAHPGKLDDLLARFRNHTCRIFEKHGMENIGYWVPADNADNQLIYFLAYPSRQARDEAWKKFEADPDWQAAFKASTVNGRLVKKVDSILLSPTDYSPATKPSSSQSPRLFELRTYTTPPGKLDHLHSRFRDHTMELFSKHGMTHLGYWTPIEEKDGAQSTLIYILAHASQQARDASFAAFRADPAWIKAKTESERDGSLTEKVESVLMQPTDFSKTR